MSGVIAAFQSLGVVFSDERANFDDSVVTDTSAEKRRDMMGAWSRADAACGIPGEVVRGGMGV